MAAPHFAPAALKFLRGLKRNNDREWFEPRKHIYEAELKAPMLAVIAALNEAMLDYSPHHVRPPQKIMMRIYRDIRFKATQGKERPLTKPRIAAWWGPRRTRKNFRRRLLLTLQPQQASHRSCRSLHARALEQLLAIRRYIAEHHTELRSLLNARKLKAARVESRRV